MTGPARGVDPSPDPNRLLRTHVVGVRFHQRAAEWRLDLSDGSEMTWDAWCDGGCAALRVALARSRPADPAGPPSGGVEA